MRSCKRWRNYQQALALLKLLPESPARNSRATEVRQSVVRSLRVTKGYTEYTF